MSNKQAYNINALFADVPLITQLLHKNAEETISDEEVMRVVEPIREMIYAGHFTTYQKPQKQKRKWAFLTGTLAAVIMVTLVGGYALNQNPAQEPMRNLIEIEPQSIPLAGALPGIAGAESMRLVLLSETSESNTEEIHIYNEIPDGIWGIMVTIDGEEMQAGTLIVENGVTGLKQG